MNHRCSAPVTLAAAVLGLSQAAHAQVDYSISLLSGGQSSATVQPGDSIALDVVLTPGAAQSMNSATFNLLLSSVGLQYDSYQWNTPFAAGSVWDHSDPAGAAGASVKFDNFAPSGFFTAGTLLVAGFTVPKGIAPGTQITFSPQLTDNSFVNGPTAFSTSADSFTLDVADVGAAVPEPASLALLAGSALCLLRRPRR